MPLMNIMFAGLLLITNPNPQPTISTQHPHPGLFLKNQSTRALKAGFIKTQLFKVIDLFVANGQYSVQRLQREKQQQGLMKTLDMLGLRPGMPIQDVLSLGIKLKPYLNFAPTSYSKPHAFYGMETFSASHLPFNLLDADLVLLSFDLKHHLKSIQVESHGIADRDRFPNINARIKQLEPLLTEIYGQSTISFPNYFGSQIRNYLPEYVMHHNHVSVKLAPIIRSYDGETYVTSYILRYDYHG